VRQNRDEPVAACERVSHAGCTLQRAKHAGAPVLCLGTVMRASAQSCASVHSACRPNECSAGAARVLAAGTQEKPWLRRPLGADIPLACPAAEPNLAPAGGHEAGMHWQGVVPTCLEMRGGVPLIAPAGVAASASGVHGAEAMAATPSGAASGAADAYLAQPGSAPRRAVQSWGMYGSERGTAAGRQAVSRPGRCPRARPCRRGAAWTAWRAWPRNRPGARPCRRRPAHRARWPPGTRRLRRTLSGRCRCAAAWRPRCLRWAAARAARARRRRGIWCRTVGGCRRRAARRSWTWWRRTAWRAASRTCRASPTSVSWPPCWACPHPYPRSRWRAPARRRARWLSSRCGSNATIWPPACRNVACRPGVSRGCLARVVTALVARQWEGCRGRSRVGACRWAHV